jgi:hypothetical protein
MPRQWRRPSRIGFVRPVRRRESRVGRARPCGHKKESLLAMPPRLAYTRTCTYWGGRVRRAGGRRCPGTPGGASGGRPAGAPASRIQLGSPQERLSRGVARLEQNAIAAPAAGPVYPGGRRAFAYRPTGTRRGHAGRRSVARRHSRSAAAGVARITTGFTRVDCAARPPPHATAAATSVASGTGRARVTTELRLARLAGSSASMRP